ncbi:MAG TPA: AI-2E family transporter [Marmoricola sp.]|nr:AI-2E family transporter [Marmoricola sp.]
MTGEGAGRAGSPEEPEDGDLAVDPAAPVPAPGSGDSGDREVTSVYGEPGRPLKHTPFFIGLTGGLGFALAWWLAGRVQAIGSVLVLVLVALFLAAGLNPAVAFFERRRLRRGLALLVVMLLVLVALALFVFALMPVISDQVQTISQNAPQWLDQLQHNRQIQQLNRKYDIIPKAQHYIQSGDLLKKVFGGALNFGLAVLSAIGSIFVVLVLTLYFLASLPRTKWAIYNLAPASRRDRVAALGDEILRGVGGYVSGAFVVALCAGLSTMIMLFIVGMGQYALALAFVVALLDVIPMIGATLGAIIVCAIGFATDVRTGIILVIFYIVYQQVENYLIYPRVMARSVEVPGVVTVIAAVIGAGLLGVIGALLAIPIAAAILLLVREVWVRRQDAR